MTNKKRVALAKRALTETREGGPQNGGNDWPEAITDLLADLRHLCDAMNLNYADLDRQAYDHYCAEAQREYLRAKEGR